LEDYKEIAMQRYDTYKDSGVKWLGEIPGHWEVLALKHILKSKKVLVGKHSSQYELLSLTLKGVVKRDMDNPEGKFPASFDTYQFVEPNDFIFCNFDNEETPRAVGHSPYKGMITGAYDVLSRNNPKLTDGFLIYYFLYIDDAKRFKPLYKGLRKTVPFDSFMSYKIPIPSLKEQDAIVSYLDTATAQIDAAIAQQQKMIDLLNERKQIIINRAVTKGLNPNAKMKDSGVEWIGEVPEGWEIVPMKYCVRIKNGMDYKHIQTDSGFPVIGSGGQFAYASEYIYDGEVVFFGRKGTVDKPLYYKGKFWVVDTMFYTIPNNKIIAKYLYYQGLTIPYKYYSTSTALPSMTQTDLGNNPICLPPIGEQTEIVEYLDRRCAKIDNAISNCDRKISFLQERKQIIINEVVTGKIKVN